MTNTPIHKTPDQSEKEVKDQTESAAGETSDIQDPKKPNRALSKREIMEQLSRERFPWEE